MEGKNNRQAPRAILVFGAPSSGKTTFAENFAKKFKMPFYDLEDMGNRYDLSRQKVLLIIEQILRTGSNLIIEGGLNTEQERDEIRSIMKLAGYNASLVWIQTDVPTIKARLKSKLKSEAKAKSEYENGIKGMEAPSEREAVIVLSGKHTFETQLKHVLHQLI